MRNRIYTTMISIVLLLFVQAAYGNKPAQKYNSKPSQEAQVQRVLDRRLVDFQKSLNEKLRDCKNRLDRHMQPIKKSIEELKEILSKTQLPTNNQKTIIGTTVNYDKIINGVKKSNKEIIVAIYIVGGVTALLIVLFIPILLLRTRKQKMSFDPLLERLEKLETNLINERKTSNAAKVVPLSIEGITSGVAAKLEDRFQALRTTLSNNKGQVDISPVIKMLEQIKNDLLAENKRLKTNETSILKQQGDLAVAQTGLNSERERCRQKEEGLDKIIAENKEAIRLEVQNSESRKYKAELAKYEEKCENLRNRADGLAKRLDDTLEENTSLRAEKELAAQTGFQNGCASQIDKIETLSKDLGELNQKLAKAQRDMEQLREQEQQKFELRLSQEKEKVESEVKQNFETKVNELSSTVNAQKTIIEQREESLRQLSAEKSEIEKNNIEQKTEIDRLNRTVDQKENDISEARQEIEKITALLKKQEEVNGSLQKSNENLTFQCKDLAAQINCLTEKNTDAELKIKELQKAIYPEVFISEREFAPLKEHLDEWMAKHLPGAEIVKSSLALFAQRESLNPETWQLALRNISQGITTVLKSQNTSVSSVINELVQWSKFLMKYSDENFDFSLKIPNAGDAVDVSWMSPVNKKAIKVSQIVTWAVWHNQYGVRYNAEVE